MPNRRNIAIGRVCKTAITGSPGYKLSYRLPRQKTGGPGAFSVRTLATLGSPRQLFGDGKPLHVAGAFIDTTDLGVAIELLHRIVLGEAAGDRPWLPRSETEPRLQASASSMDSNSIGAGRPGKCVAMSGTRGGAPPLVSRRSAHLLPGNSSPCPARLIAKDQLFRQGQSRGSPRSPPSFSKRCCFSRVASAAKDGRRTRWRGYPTSASRCRGSRTQPECAHGWRMPPSPYPYRYSRRWVSA